MKRFALATALLLVSILPVQGQQLSDFASATLGLSPSDPALSGLILDTVAPLGPIVMPAPGTSLIPAPVFDLTAPLSGIGYDAHSGETYRWWRTPDGGTRLRGLIPAAGGSSWSGSISASGSWSGVDSNLNRFRYDPGTGTRINTTTGEICLSPGLAAPCR